MTPTTLDLGTLHLEAGSHRDPDVGMCLLEAASVLAREPFGDRPTCVSRVLITYGQQLNDTLPDTTRQQLVPFLPRMLNTDGDGLDDRRSYLALDWLTRTYLPTWLRLVPALTAPADLLAAAHEVVDLESAARIGEIVREASAQAAAARAAARDAAGNAAGAAARAAARAAAWAALAPTVTALQHSAIDLLDRMIRPVAA